MSAFAAECREKAARYAERAAGYRAAGVKDLAHIAREVSIGLSRAAHYMTQLESVEADAAERMQP